MNYLLVLYNNEMDIFFGKEKKIRNNFRNLYIISHHSPSISRLVPKKIMDLQFGGLFK
jgi:hypothetical protein